MPEIEYAIEVESRTSITNAAHGISNGFFRFITGRPSFVALGDSVAFSVTINGAETMNYAFNTGQLYQASNPPFKIVNTVPSIGMVFTVLGALDFTGGDLATAKGSAPVNSDMFRVDQNGMGDVDAIPENLATFGQNGDLDVLLIATFGYLNEIGPDPAVTYVGQNIWHNDFIVKKGLGTPSRSTGNGIERTGDYGTLSGFTFKIKNTNKIWKFLEDNEIYVVNKECRLYAVIDEVFYQLWEGVVKNLSRTDTKFGFECIDAFKKYHKTIPPNTISETEFPDVNSDFIGEPIPVAVGDVVYNRVLNIASQVVVRDPVGIWAYFPDGEYNAWDSILAGVVPGGTEGKPAILVYGYFGYLASSLDTMYIRIVQGSELATDVLYKVHNLGTKQYPNPDWLTVFVLDQPLEGLEEQSQQYFYENLHVDISEEALLTEAWCQIVDVDYKHIVSNQEIKEFVLTNGLPTLLNWVEDFNAYMDISRLVLNSRTDSGGDPAYPHLRTFGRTVADDGSILMLSRIIPQITSWEDVVCSDINGITHIEPIPADYKDEIDNMVDINRNTYCDITKVRKWDVSRGGQTYSMVLQIDVHIPPELTSDGVEKAYFAIDFGYNLTNSTPNDYFLELVGVDAYDREFESDAKHSAGFEFPDPQGTFSGHVILLPNDYYEGGYPGSFDSNWGMVLPDEDGTVKNMVELIEISDEAMQPIQNGVARKIRLRLRFRHPGQSNIIFNQLRIHEIGFVIATKVDLIGTKLYTRLKGEYSTLTDTFESNTVYRAFQLMLQKYDGLPDERIDWHNISATRGDWHVGRQLTKQTNSFDYLKELCKQSFVCLCPTREGKRRLSAWLENPFPVDVHDETEICEGSIKNIKLTPVSSLYNSFEIQYAYNPARKDYDKTIFIHKVDEDLTDIPIVNWQTYVGGIGDYVTANEYWKACRYAYIQAEVEQPAPEELSKLNWYVDYDLFSQTRAYSGANNSAAKFLSWFVSWCVYQKNIVTYDIPMNARNVGFCELLNFITFNDTIFTDGIDWGGWVRKVKYLLYKDRIQVTLIFRPRLPYDSNLIIERGDQGDPTITERGDQGDDTITEGGV